MALAIPPNHRPPPPPHHNLPITFNTSNGDSLSPSHHSRLLHLLNQCTSMSQLKQIHAHTLRTTSTTNPHTLFLHSRILHFSSLTDIRYAFRVFNQIESPNSFTWNTLIRGCARISGLENQAILLYCKMLSQGVALPDEYTFPFVLRACAYLFALPEGKQAHAHVVKLGFCSDVYIGNSLIHLYASCGCLDYAQKVFEKMYERSLVSWNVMIDSLVGAGEFESSLKVFGQMQRLFEPDGYTMQSVINACAGLGALDLGIWAHAYVLRKCGNAVASNVLVNSSLVDMYCKCGSLDMALQVFEGMPKRDVITWNYMILGFAMHGKAEAALKCFDRMVNMESCKPNSITFVGVLSACNHRGMVNEGRKFFNVMVKEYKIEPRLEHYGCLVDLLARAGFIDEALNLVTTMPVKPDAVIWRSLLDACSRQQHASIELSEEVARQILESGGEDVSSGVYVLLSRVYASASRWNDVGSIRKLMTEEGIAKEPGCSLIDIDGITHEFFAGDTSHPHSREIYQVLDAMKERLK
ncbi:putative tetratricopeptide-like helical domain, DYW domain-containing protein [Rosa chinensis]|uniref:Putative tetratricopeptide-like helical domain, DYW domain-containing protein n=1 Tax=Rosa chinensis TaxID=74649 RepID=A0A2P6SA84_ROSCH|nr:pentatricopeptide repeat-containing protein At1g59720, chloroplastic/mitochondrial [Rosa chinensis]XP_024193329.1 pentatricopeptide repeat-containing protein At1g59720, chloroplastic/mitochondrial [Rosa chinensis]XP_040364467.1 pentatricopeptide repeat-containing protein At1g59720, chloroplastic/mitochondrial [Rosa chinensis]PRQ55579.1 putative tetratricopeptide-like helical domain, DYW domain-containing protein [Rosa chinensis]